MGLRLPGVDLPIEHGWIFAACLMFACTGHPPSTPRLLQHPSPECAAPASDPRRLSSDGWQLEAPDGDVDARRALWAPGEDELWASPSKGGVIERFRAGLVERYAVPGQIHGFWGSAPDDVWAVGDTIQHWDGSCWTQVLVPPSQLRAVWGTASTEVWAGGFDGVLLRWDGQSWQPQDPGTDDGVLAIWASAPDDLWVVTNDLGVVGNGAIRRWDGLQWTDMMTGRFYSIWGSGSDDVWVVDSRGAGLQRFDGLGWSRVTAPLDLVSVWGTGPDDIYGVTMAGQVLERDGQSWRVAFEVTDANLRYDKRLFALAGVGGTRWAAGDSGLVLRRDAQGWRQLQPLGDLRAITAAVATSADEMWWAQGGEVFHRTSAGITREDVDSTEDVRRLVRTDAGTLWAVVGRDRVLRRAAGPWTESTRVEPWLGWIELQDLAATADDNVWVVGYDEHVNGGRWPVARHFDGTRWHRHELPRELGRARSVLSFGPSDTWIGGENRVAYWDGTELRVERLAEDNNTRRVTGLWGASSATLFAATSAGVWRRDGDGWSVLPGSTGPDGPLAYRVWGRSEHEVYVGGWGGLARWDGRQMHEIALPSFVSTLTVFGAGDDTCLAGDLGVLMCRRSRP